MNSPTAESRRKPQKAKASQAKNSNDISLFGIKPISIVVAVVALVQGMNQITDLAVSYLYKDDYNFSPVEVSMIASFIIIPWMIKPIWGVISDNVTFFGYRRKSYLILWGTLQFFYYFSLATWVHNRWLGLALLLLIQLSLAFNNVIGEALVVESSQEVQVQENVEEEHKQAEASKNVSLFFGMKYLGILSTAYLSGFLLQFMDKQDIFLIAAMLPILVVAVSIFIMREKRAVQSHEVIYQASPEEVPQEEIPLNQDVETNAGSGEQVFAASEGSAENDEMELRSELNIYLGAKESSWKRLVDFIVKPAISKPIVFLLLFMFTPSCSSSMFYFYTNELGFSPDFMGTLKFANALASIIGIFLFNRYFKNYSFQKIFFWSTIICTLLGSTQILLVLRWNKHLGISDKLFCVGDSVIIQSIAEINYLPVLILACRLCPKNLEATMYALLMSVLNFGGMLGSQVGALLAYLLGITSTNFDKLWIMILIAQISMLLPLPFLRMVKVENTAKEAEQGDNDEWLKNRTRMSA